MIDRDSLWEDLAGDLEYHPGRAAVYLSLGAISLGIWIFSPHDFIVIPLVFGLGSVSLLIKGIFLLRKSSEGIGLTEKDLDALSNNPNRKGLPSVTSQTGQIVQDFGAGALFLEPVVMSLRVVAPSSMNLKPIQIILLGTLLFFFGWLIRYVSKPPSEAGSPRKNESF